MNIFILAWSLNVKSLEFLQSDQGGYLDRPHNAKFHPPVDLQKNGNFFDFSFFRKFKNFSFFGNFQKII